MGVFALVASASTPSRAEEPEALDVTVRGEARSDRPAGLTRGETRATPGAFDDPFRSIGAMPGVTPMTSFVPYFFVRGAPPGNVGYFLDGVRVPSVFHVGIGPSVVHPALVERVDFHAGPYPARHGRFAGGIVSARTEPPRAYWHGEASLRLFDAGALVEAPFAERRGTVLLAGRYSYASTLLSLVSPDVDLGYWDYQGRASYDLTRRDRISALWFGAADFLEDESETPREVILDAEFHRLDLRYDVHERDARVLRLAVTLGFDETRSSGLRRIEDLSVGSRVELARRLGRGATFEAGADVRVDAFDSEWNPPCVGAGCPVAQDVFDAPRDSQIDATFAELFPPREDLEAGVHASVSYRLARGATVSPGVRVDAYSSEGESAIGVDPRLSGRFQVHPDVALLPAFGVVHQLPSFLPGAGFQISGIRGGLQRAIQTSMGLEAELPHGVTATVTGFRHAVLGLTDPLGTTRGGGLGVERFTRRSTGLTHGLELGLRRPLSKRIGGFVSYTLSRSTRTIDGRTVPSAFDRTHVLSTAIGYRLAPTWRAGIRSSFYSGFPKDEQNIYRPPLERPDRVRPFFRLDWRLEKSFPIGDAARLAVVLEMMNATFAPEVYDVECDAELVRGGDCREVDLGPVTVPSVGLEAAF